MMNKLLRDLINTEKVAAFIDDVIIGMEMEEGHDKIVAEVIRRLKENDLYVKLEKCKWKVRERVFRSGDRTRRNQDREGEGERSAGLADT